MKIHLSRVKKDVKLALKEDLQNNDISLLGLKDRKVLKKAYLISREDAYICGVDWFNESFKQVAKRYRNQKIFLKWRVKDGNKIKKNQKILEILANADTILSAERTALNFLQTLSGICTKTQSYRLKLNTKSIKLLDTRKTIPNLRYAEKYAVRKGKGFNHRFGLFDQILIKENHISSQNIGFENFVKYLEKKDILRNATIEVEDLNQVKILTKHKVKSILLDNFSISEIKKAIKLINRKAKIEVSGNISIKNIQKYKNLSINYISVGDLTKNIKAVDFSLLLKN